MEKENIQETAMETAHNYVALKSDIRHKIMDLAKSKNKEILDIHKIYRKKNIEHRKDMERFDEIHKKSQKKIMSSIDNEDFAKLVPKINDYQKTNHVLLQNQEDIEKKKELTQLFREENKELIDEYKKAGHIHRHNENIVGMFVRLLKSRKIAELDIDAFRKNIGFESVDIPRHIWDKQELEARGVVIEGAIKQLTPREAETVMLYFQGGDMKKLAEKLDITPKRIRQIKKMGLRRLRRRVPKKSEIREDILGGVSQINEDVEEKLLDLFEGFGNEFSEQGLDFKMTCLGCPTLYDIFKDGKLVGGLGLRRGIIQGYLGDQNSENSEGIYSVNYRDDKGGLWGNVCKRTDIENIARTINERIKNK